MAFRIGIETNGGDDGTRTCGLWPDRAAGIGFTTTYKNAGSAQIPARHTRPPRIVGWRFAFPCSQQDQSFPNLDLCQTMQPAAIRSAHGKRKLEQGQGSEIRKQEIEASKIHT